MRILRTEIASPHQPCGAVRSSARPALAQTASAATRPPRNDARNRHCEPPKGAKQSQSRHVAGFTLVELLITMLISILVLFATAVPFAAQGNFWAKGTSQVEAQRDAQLVLSAIAHNARQKVNYAAISISPGNGILVLREPCGSVTFQGGPAFGGQLQSQVTGTCPPPAVNLTLIDGVRSRVTNFTPIQVDPPSCKLLRIQLSVTHTNRNSEFLDTVIHLRNAA